MGRNRDDAQGDLLSGLGGSGAPDQAAPPPAKRKTRRRAAPAEGGPGKAGTVMELDPATCRLWERHNRRPGLLDETSCADLIAGIRVQGRQEFPAIVRQVRQDGGAVYEVICGARRHFAVTWLRANGHPEMPFLVEVRDLPDEEAFRLADIENRDRGTSATTSGRRATPMRWSGTTAAGSPSWRRALR
ncbi:ParB N-terminal domain-containing protein [Poseidonocella sp. HB161398]|uniref:ParB N-terminal domain-containing protein n=1 Tax=Poseidonocella sp. HB161398 TaxID=2320855 RepID=UPI001F0D57F8|nr:ParB N-terminal domain-containing protein [Poseidonocella sp. HB161398]